MAIGFVIIVAAQDIPRNPRNIEFVCADHDRDDQHELDILDSGGNVIQTILLGDPPVGQDGIVRTTINIQPITFGEYTARVRARAGDLISLNSAPSNMFLRAPGQPSGVIVR